MPVRRRFATLVAAALALGAVPTVVVATAASATAPPAIHFDSGRYDFGPVLDGSNPESDPFTVVNDGPGTATGLAFHVAGSSFAVRSTTCGTSLAAGHSCQVVVEDTAQGYDQQFGGITATVDGGGATAVSLQAEPTTSPSPVRVTPTALDFGAVPVGTTSPGQVIAVTNTTTSNVSVTVAIQGSIAPFTLATNGCTPAPRFLQHGGGTCALTFTIDPSASGDVVRKASLDVTVAGLTTFGWPLTLQAHGGTAGAYPLRITGRRLDFGAVAIGSTSAEQDVTVTNTSSAPVTLAHVYGGAANGEFGNGNRTCDDGVVLAAGASCFEGYVAKPITPGTHAYQSGFTLSIAGFPDDTITLPLTEYGSGTGPALLIKRSAPVLGPSAIGHATATATVKVTNPGNAPLAHVAVVAGSDSHFTLASTTCTATLAAGSSCSLGFRYTPTDTTERFARWQVTSDLPTQDIDLTGGPPMGVNLAFVRWAALALVGPTTTSQYQATTAAALDAGSTSRRAVVTALANSEERVTVVVQRLYLNTLGRQGDAGGARYWEGQIRSGKRSVAQVAAQFYASNEYYAHLGGGTDASWVTDLYVKLLHRTPDSSGLSYWVSQTHAHGRVHVAGLMFQSLESRKARVTALYEELLEREPDSGGRDFWAAKILTQGDIVLAIELTSSTEFLRDAVLRAGEG